MKYTTALISDDLWPQITDFACEYVQLYDYLVDPAKALADKETGKALTYVVKETASNRVYAYFSIECSCFRTKESNDNGPYRPAIEITKMAVDSRFQRQGVGKYTLSLAIDFIKELRSIMPVDAILVFALANVTNFYSKLNFKQCYDIIEARSRYKWVDCVLMYYLLEKLID